MRKISRRTRRSRRRKLVARKRFWEIEFEDDDERLSLPALSWLSGLD
jgi:hypothetical protein